MSEPRTWAMPDMPSHGTLVRSSAGEIYRRRDDDEWETNWGAAAEDGNYGCCSWKELLVYEGPLTEVVDHD